MKIPFLKNKPTSALLASTQGQNITFLPAFWIRRLLGNILLLAIIASIAVTTITVRENLINKKIDFILEYFYETSAKYGWALDDIIIQGREKTSREDILTKLNLSRNDNILKINLGDVKEKIEKLPWVETATVKRSFFPNILQITIAEKKVLALWQYENKFYPIDCNGKLINAEFVPHHPVLVIVGDKAPEKINSLLKIISSSPEVMKRIKAAKLYSGRRWDIILNDIENGLTIRMPETKPERAWKKFIKINQQHGLLKRKLTFIDLRYKNKLIVTVDSSAFAESDGNKN